MNILLFDPGEELRPLPREDLRARHLTQILKVVPGQAVRAGIVGGAEGTIEITEVTPDSVGFVWRPGEPEAVQTEAALPGTSGGDPDPPVVILLGHPRPPVLRRLFKDLTTVGVAEILVAPGELTEKSYLESKVWEPRTLRGALVEGASQGGSTRIPEVHRFHSLRRALGYLEAPSPGELRLLLDQNATTSLFGISAAGPGQSAVGPAYRRVVFSVGPERGWTDAERRRLLDSGFLPVGLGDRILRTETAALVGATYLRGFLRMEAGAGTE